MYSYSAFVSNFAGSALSGLRTGPANAVT